MTIERRDKGGTQLGEWLRHQKEIDSSLGFNTSNLDFYWTDRNGNILMFEEKRQMKELTSKQREIFSVMDKAMWKAKEGYEKDNLIFLYHGFYFIQFENTNPDDGKMYINGILVSRDEYIKFLKFELKIKSFDFSKSFVMNYAN